jgi:hypothetical protein
MKRFDPRLLLPLALTVVLGMDAAWAARAGGGSHGGGWSGARGAHGSQGHRHFGHGAHGHRHSGHGHHGSRSHFGLGFFFGAPFYSPWHYDSGWWPYSSYYAPPAYRYYGGPAYYESAPAAFSDTAALPPPPQQQNAAWYYCASLDGYYPYVGPCPEAWERVPVVPPSLSEKGNRPD